MFIESLPCGRPEGYCDERQNFCPHRASSLLRAIGRHADDSTLVLASVLETGGHSRCLGNKRKEHKFSILDEDTFELFVPSTIDSGSGIVVYPGAPL